MTQTEAHHRYRLKKEDLEVSQQAVPDIGHVQGGACPLIADLLAAWRPTLLSGWCLVAIVSRKAVSVLTGRLWAFILYLPFYAGVEVCS